MTGTRRLSILAIIALMIVACGSATPASQPASQAAVLPTDEPSIGPTKSPWAAITPMPTPPRLPIPTGPLPTLAPDASCGMLGLVISPTFEPGAIDVYLGALGQHIALGTERAVSVEDPAAVWPGGYDYGDGLPDLIRLRGGGDVILTPELDYDFPFEWPLEIHHVKAVLHVPGESRRRIDARVLETPGDSDVVALSLPDRDVRGTLTLDLEASDRCITYTSTGVGQVLVVRGATVDACPRNSKGFAEHWAAIGEPPIQAGGVPVTLSRTSTLGLWTPYAVSAQGNVGFAHWVPASEAAVGAVGRTVRVGDGNPSLKLESLATEFFRRKDIVAWLDGGDWPGRDRIVFRSTAEPYPDGHFELLLPPRPGRYVASFYFRWESPCAYGDGAGAVGIDVE